MRKFVVNVNGKQYEVEVEELAAGAAAPVFAATVAAPVAVAAPAPVAAPAAPAAASAPGEGKPVAAPMPGTIVDVKVKVGDTVKPGDVLAILEAMKMENEIMSDMNGTVTSIVNGKGSNVSSGDIIMTIA